MAVYIILSQIKRLQKKGLQDFLFKVAQTLRKKISAPPLKLLHSATASRSDFGGGVCGCEVRGPHSCVVCLAARHEGLSLQMLNHRLLSPQLFVLFL